MDVRNAGVDVETAAKKLRDTGSTLKNEIFGKDGLNFRDVIDLINPLQHIPIVGRIYRAITNDQIAPGIRIAGGTIFGGPVGAAFAAAGLAIDKTGGMLAQKLATGDKNTDGMLDAPAYSIDRVIAQRRATLDVHNNLISGLSPERNDRLVGDNVQLVNNIEWPYSARQRHMPFVKISQLIEENYRFLESESKNHGEKNKEDLRFDRKM